MKKILIFALLVIMATGTQAAKKKAVPRNNKPVFTIVKQNKITSIRDQNCSGMCWTYSTLSFLEGGILKKTGKTYDLYKMFVTRKAYQDQAGKAVRMHGDVSLAQGGSTYDPVYCWQYYGMMPETAMPLPGTMTDGLLASLSEFFELLIPHTETMVKSKQRKIFSTWGKGMVGVLNTYPGKTPGTSTYDGKTYIPQSLTASLRLNMNDYVHFISYVHRPFWT